MLAALNATDTAVGTTDSAIRDPLLRYRRPGAKPWLSDRGFSYMTSRSEIYVKNQPDTAPSPIVVEISIAAALHG